MSLAESIKDLTVLGALFGPKAKKLSGLCDALSIITDNMTFTSTDTIVLSNIPANFLQVGSYFRITGGGGANENALFKVLSIAGATLTVDTSVTPVSSEPLGLATIDARLATVVNNETLAKLNSKGNTIFNVNQCQALGIDVSCSGILEKQSDHYHDTPASAKAPFKFNFTISDWNSCDSGDLYCIDVVHNLDTICPDLTGFFDEEQVDFHAVRVIDSNTVRIKVAQEGVDCRFAGRGIVSSH